MATNNHKNFDMSHVMQL